jgi:MFS family permease
MRNAYLFAAFNALSFQIVLGSPMVLYAKQLGASATVLGILAGMMPLLVIFQIPAARHVTRVGYKKFVLAGWSTRVMFIFLIALVPLTGGFLSAPTRIAVLLFLLFGFNLSRGISSAAWLPWITAIVPAPVRGQYLARDSACVNAASTVTLALSGLALGVNPGGWQFFAAFLFSAVNGVISLSFLKRIPDATPPGAAYTGPEPVPWRAILGHRPFRKLLEAGVAWSLAYGGLTTFVVAYLKSSVGVGENWILYTTAVCYFGGIGGLLVFGAHLDRHGSKPIILVCVSGWLAILAVWVSLAGGWLQVTLGLVFAIQLLMGLGYAALMMAMTRLAMAVVPSLGREHFFALYSVTTNLSLGVSPVLWGLVIDAFGERRFVGLGFELNRYSCFFALVLLTMAGTLVLVRRLEEPQAGRVEALLRDLLAQMPLPSWMRFWPRG